MDTDRAYELKVENDKWVQFYPLDMCDMLMPFKSLDDLPPVVYGKYVKGVVGYSIAWAHIHAQKKSLREQSSL
tara:strand:+ start:241 stop:459 length:219 start_codon:yes stop_codon:yes gene_type:complete